LWAAAAAQLRGLCNLCRLDHPQLAAENSTKAQKEMNDDVVVTGMQTEAALEHETNYGQLEKQLEKSTNEVTKLEEEKLEPPWDGID